MKHFRRQLFNGLAILSLLLCVATAGLWARSHFGFAYDHWETNWGHSGSSIEIVSSNGILIVWIFDSVPATQLPGAFKQNFFVIGFARFGISSESASGAPIGKCITEFMAQDWLVVAIAALLPAAWIDRRIKDRKRARLAQANRCLKCGYDLRATPDRCPECGTIPKKVD